MRSQQTKDDHLESTHSGTSLRPIHFYDGRSEESSINLLCVPKKTSSLIHSSARKPKLLNFHFIQFMKKRLSDPLHKQNGNQMPELLYKSIIGKSNAKDSLNWEHCVGISLGHLRIEKQFLSSV